MSIEEYLLDTGKSLENKMTDFEKKCYGITETQIREEYMNSLTAKFSGNEMVVMGILSDCQEMLERNYFTKDDVRKQMNIAKFILSEMMDEKRTATA
jgi:hypothetical protein